MPEQNTQAPEMDESEEVFSIVFVSRDQSSIVLEPREESLDLPSMSVPAKRAAILCRIASSIRLVRRDHLDASFLPEPLVEWITVVGLVADQTVGVVWEEAVLDRLVDEGDFMWRSTCDPGGDRKTSAV